MRESSRFYEQKQILAAHGRHVPVGVLSRLTSCVFAPSAILLHKSPDFTPSRIVFAYARKFGIIDAITRREFLIGGSAFVAGHSVLARAASAARQPASRAPNIIVIVADDVAPRYLGCYGGPTPTPHLDRLAADGVRCTRAYASAWLCNPSRYALLTGQFAGRNLAAYASYPADRAYWLGQTTGSRLMIPASPARCVPPATTLATSANGMATLHSALR